MKLPRIVSLVGGVALLAATLPIGAASAQSTVAISAEDFMFDAFDTIATVGDDVTWTNTGTAAHTVVGTGEEFSTLLNPGDTFSFTPTEAGEIRYFCTFHGTPDDGMHGFLTVIEEGAEAPEPREQPSVEFGAVSADGDDNVAAAIGWTSLIPDGEGTTVAIGRDDDFADLLAAGASGLPLLLTPTDALDARVDAELDRLGTTAAFVVGGTAAVSEDVVEALEAKDITVTRLAGDTRIETAVAIAEELFVGPSEFAQPPGDAPTPPGAIIARAFGVEGNPTAGFADSLGAAAAGAVLNVPVLVSDTAGLSAPTLQFLVDNGLGEVVLAGGEAALSAQVEADLTAAGITSTRVAGDSRDATAAALKAYLDSFGPANPYDNVVIVDGFNADAWAQGFGAAALGSTVLLSNGDDVPAITQDALSDGGQTVLLAFVGAKNVRCAPGVSQGACDLVEAVVTTVFIGPQVLLGVLEGSNETDEGSPVASGLFSLAPVEGGICYEYITVGLGSPDAADPIVGAHIHRGGAGEAGDVVIPLSTAGVEDGESNGCTLDVDPALVEEVFASPGDFYANLHTPTFPAGAVRDNLFVYDDLSVADLSGDQEVPGPGAPMAGGVSFLTTNDDDDLCHITFFGGLDGPATAAHVHTGGADEAGPVLIGLTVSPVGIPVHADCIEDTDADALAAFRADPAGHYVNVHTESFPAGAIRGQANPQYDLTGM